MTVARAATVERLDVEVYTVPTDAPEGDGTLTWDATTMVLVSAHGGGATGTGYTYSTPAAADVVEQQLAGVVTGREALDVPGAAAAMAHDVRNAGRPGLVSTAISAVDCALWDLKARLLDVALCSLLGRVREVVPVYGSGGFTTYDEQQLRDQLRHWVHRLGLPRVKMKIGESHGSRTDRDLARVRQARKEVGEEVELMVDANGGYSVGQAVRMGRALSDLGVTWFEEPVSSDDLPGLHEVRGQITPDVAAGEYGYTLPYFTAMVGARSVDCLQVDVTRCGGVTEWLRAAAVAAGAGLEVSGHCAPALHAPVLTALPNLRHLEYFHDHVRIESRFFPGSVEVVRGGLRPDPERPGNGLELDQDAAEQFRTR